MSPVIERWTYRVHAIYGALDSTIEVVDSINIEAVFFLATVGITNTEAMEPAAKTLLGKRGQRTQDDIGGKAQRNVEAEEQNPPPKRLRTQTSVDNAAISGPSAACPRNGLLTPEPSDLTEPQLMLSPAVVSSDMPLKAFPFLKLPAELRIHIYHMALVREEPLLLHADRAPDAVAEDECPTIPSNPRGRFSSCAPDSQIFSLYPFNTRSRPRPQSSGIERVPLKDPIAPEFLRLNKLVYREARQVLYSDNVFILSLNSGVYTLSTLHQRSRSLIKHIVLSIPSHHDILDGFSLLVRVGLRYCWGLKTLKIILETSLPDDGRQTGSTNVYANAFQILRWLPRGCKVGLEGDVSDTVRRVVDEEGRLQAVLDEASYLKRQHVMPDRHEGRVVS